jgi:hypothetical protein
MSVTRTIEINDLSPGEMAALFTEMRGEQQAQFFSAVWDYAKAWPGAGWCQQSCDIVSHADSAARSAISTLAAHLEPEA